MTPPLKYYFIIYVYMAGHFLYVCLFENNKNSGYLFLRFKSGELIQKSVQNTSDYYGEQDATQERLSRKCYQFQFGIMILLIWN